MDVLEKNDFIQKRQDAQIASNHLKENVKTICHLFHDGVSDS